MSSKCLETVCFQSCALAGETGSLCRNISRNWLLGLRESNPAILDMIRDRNCVPYRDLLPWSGEFAGKYLTGSYYIFKATGDAELYDYVVAFIDELLSYQDGDGYCGCFSDACKLTGAFSATPELPGQTWDAWNHYHLMYGLSLWYTITQSVRYLTAVEKMADLFMGKFYNGKPPLSSIGNTEMNLSPYHMFALLYNMTGKEKYLAFARQMETDLKKDTTGDYINVALAGIDFYQCKKPRWESLHIIMGILEMYAATGEDRYIQAVEQIVSSIIKTDVHNTGAFSTNEQAIGNPYSPGAIETCCVVAFNALVSQLYSYTGKATLLDFLELSHYNAVLGAFSPTGKWSTYDTPMDGVKKANTQDIVFQSRAGCPFLNCCSVNAPRGVGTVTDWMIACRGDALEIHFFEPLHMETRDGIVLDIESVYPAPGPVTIRIDSAGVKRKIGIRIPAWSEKTRIGKEKDTRAPSADERYVYWDEVWTYENPVVLSLDFTPYFACGELGLKGKSCVYSGPVLYGLDATDNPGISVDNPPLLKKEELKRSPVSRKQDGSITIESGNVVLTDFYHCGKSGSKYVTWLPIA